MTRIAVLGVTGSIGRQALEVIEANDDLELVAATSGSTPIDGLAPLTQVGGDARGVAAGRRVAPARRQRALGSVPAPRGHVPGPGPGTCPHGLGRPVPRTL